mgnify:CR=1 FL=1
MTSPELTHVWNSVQVLIHGTSEEIASLREHCVDRGTFERVDMPEDGQSVDISMGSNIHRVSGMGRV